MNPYQPRYIAPPLVKTTPQTEEPVATTPQTGRPISTTGSDVGMIVGIVVGVIVFLLLIALILFFLRRRRQPKWINHDIE